MDDCTARILAKAGFHVEEPAPPFMLRDLGAGQTRVVPFPATTLESVGDFSEQNGPAVDVVGFGAFRVNGTLYQITRYGPPGPEAEMV